MRLTPERLATIQDIARSGDPYWRGYLAAVADLTQPSETPGASSCQEDTP